MLSGISAHVHHICSHVHLNLCRESQLCPSLPVNPLATVCICKQVCCVQRDAVTLMLVLIYPTMRVTLLLRAAV